LAFVVGRPEGELMRATRIAIGSDEPAAKAAPGPLPKPPGRPPAEPIVIRTPPRPRDGPEIDGSHEEDEEGGGEIRRPPPGQIPDLPPPPRPEERAARGEGRPCRQGSFGDLSLPEKRARPEGFRP
jgi:hypothetical protein